MTDTNQEAALPVDVVNYERPRGAMDVRLGDAFDPSSFVAEFLPQGIVTLWSNDLCHVTATFEDGEWKAEVHAD